MAWDNPSELVVAGTGEISVAAVGTALPTDPTANLNAGFTGTGYTDEDGVTIAVDPTITDYMAWQSRQAIRREMTQQAVSVAFKLQQWNEITVPLAFGGGHISDLGGGKYRYDFPAGSDQLDERAMVVDIKDGPTHMRFVWPRGNVSESVSSDFRRSATAILPITFRVLAPTTDPDGPPGYFLSDSAAYVTGS